MFGIKHIDEFRLYLRIGCGIIIGALLQFVQTYVDLIKPVGYILIALAFILGVFIRCVDYTDYSPKESKTRWELKQDHSICFFLFDIVILFLNLIVYQVFGDVPNQEIMVPLVIGITYGLIVFDVNCVQLLKLSREYKIERNRDNCKDDKLYQSIKTRLGKCNDEYKRAKQDYDDQLKLWRDAEKGSKKAAFKTKQEYMKKKDLSHVDVKFLKELEETLVSLSINHKKTYCKAFHEGLVAIFCCHSSVGEDDTYDAIKKLFDDFESPQA
jgi:hypothetical protein